jgi:putative serine protease PepD
MTEESRESAETPSEEGPQQAQPAPGSTPAEDRGFAPPDEPGTSQTDRLPIDGPAEQPYGAGGLSGSAGRVEPEPAGSQRPGFVPHSQDAPAGGAPYGWPAQRPQQAQTPPPPPGGTTTPFGSPPPPPPPGGTVPGYGTHGGVPSGGMPNWAPAPSPPSAPRSGPGLGVFAVIALIVALVAGAVGAGIGVLVSDGNGVGGSRSVDLGGATSNAKSRPVDSVAGVAQRLLPSVVMIKVSNSSGESGAGSGFVVQDGYIITNNHVVSEAAGGGSLEVVFDDKKTTSATVVGTDPSSDVAVIKPQSMGKLQAMQLGNSNDIAVGDSVIAIGSPLGLQGSVTAGIVSSLNRAVPTSGEDGAGSDSAVLNAIQTDAAINPGNSGGPLVDAQGRVIGINTAIATLGGGGGFGGQGQSGSIGVGFAIPINQAKRVAEQIINNGKATHARIGATMDLQYQGTGVRIANSVVNGQPPLVKGGPAEQAGLKPGDIITAFDGTPVGSPTDLLALIRSRSPGDKVKITYQRGGKQSTVEVTLGETD